mmetsp:Transcript_22189/g.33800  ORF Transcript_22189/g.33800 Transcript_22189/m.33800 type:complete len:367 (-) Transcript_22189:173-1273(-)|eukprot:CAMPEP_0194089184 /NCGR_PEP_ID=MMETSP0149-20130528/33048_1 /TAXON_ID=122233 /ORGANISM="Chaetoceros debilis, Strain MM31A-1" /LENGTH=366 /DNA_ID=CAMNT_0038773023 /DNA_START=40 /DNA_END=1140 /DNA_ORIENTATION=-
MGCTSSRSSVVVQGEHQLDISNGHTNNSASNNQGTASITPTNASQTTQIIDLTSIARRYNRNNGHDSAAADEELRQLQSDLETLERLFQSLLGQSFAAQLVRNMESTHGINFGMMQNENGEFGSCPPAAVDAIENLTCIEVTSDDLVDEFNRECCICFFQHEVGDTVARLPCGHIFHKPCITEWLEKKCTCPICRYEIQTDNQYYEVDRIERMRSRRIRLREHELDRMSLKELQDLVKWVQLSSANENTGDGEPAGDGDNAASEDEVAGDHNRMSSSEIESMNRTSLLTYIRCADNVTIIRDDVDQEEEGQRHVDNVEGSDTNEAESLNDDESPPPQSQPISEDIIFDMDAHSKHIIGTIPRNSYC